MYLVCLTNGIASSSSLIWIYMAIEYCSVPTVWCCCQQAKTQSSYSYEVKSSYGKQLEPNGIFEFLEKGRG